MPLRKLYDVNKDMIRLQDSWKPQLDFLVDSAFNRKSTFTNVVINTVDTLFSHGLDVVPTGFIVISKEGPGDIYLISKSNTQVTLKSTVQVTATFWLF
jgi:hypothetical protein